MELRDGNYLVRLTIYSVFWCFVSLSSPAATARDRIGLVKTYEPAATAIRQGEVVKLEIGSEIFQGDTIATDSSGAVGITFSDGSMITLGPGGKIIIEDFAFKPDQKKISFLSRILKGSVAFISGAIGRISPGAVQLKTPTATLGLHGTKVLVEVE